MRNHAFGSSKTENAVCTTSLEVIFGLILSILSKDHAKSQIGSDNGHLTDFLFFLSLIRSKEEERAQGLTQGGLSHKEKEQKRKVHV